MGKVNDYIKKLLNFIKKDEKKYEKPWHKYYEGQPIHLSYFNGSIYDRLYATACEHSNLAAYEYFGVEGTFNDFMKKIDKIANALTQFKIVPHQAGRPSGDNAQPEHAQQVRPDAKERRDHPALRAAGPPDRRLQRQERA